MKNGGKESEREKENRKTTRKEEQVNLRRKVNISLLGSSIDIRQYLQGKCQNNPEQNNEPSVASRV